MLNNSFYPMIFKRKSFHLFKNAGSEKIDGEMLIEIEQAYESFDRLYPAIRTAVRIVPAAEIQFKRDAEYCILIYSEKKDNYLMNAGYIGEQLDLYLVSRNIGTLWFGIGKPDKQSYDGLDYVIMLAIRKVSDESLYRKDMNKAKRKNIEEIWNGDTLGIADVARFSPSACNSQPWYVKNSANALEVYRYKKPVKIGIMTPKAASYFNRIDIGIFLCILEICMAEQNIPAERELFIDSGDNEYSVVAKYLMEADNSDTITEQNAFL